MSKTNQAKTAYLSLGSNLGDRLHYLANATKRLNQQENIQLMKTSAVYETAAWGFEDQDDFYNIVAEIKTTLTPEKLLTACQEIENQLDRTREIHWGPRTIDIDILLYQDVTLNQKSLTIPHKYLLERPFVTIPLAEIAPEIELNGIKIATVANHHLELDDKCLKTAHKL